MCISYIIFFTTQNKTARFPAKILESLLSYSSERAPKLQNMSTFFRYIARILIKYIISVANFDFIRTLELHS